MKKNNTIRKMKQSSTKHLVYRSRHKYWRTGARNVTELVMNKYFTFCTSENHQNNNSIALSYHRNPRCQIVR